MALLLRTEGGMPARIQLCHCTTTGHALLTECNQTEGQLNAGGRRCLPCVGDTAVDGGGAPMEPLPAGAVLVGAAAGLEGAMLLGAAAGSAAGGAATGPSESAEDA